MKRIVVVLFFVLMILTLHQPVHADSNKYWIMLDGKYLNTELMPINNNGSIYVPMRLIFESLHAEVTYVPEEGKVIGKKGDIMIELQLGKTMAYKNSQPILLSGPPMIVNNSVYVPIRFVSESLGASVFWKSDIHAVVIETPQLTAITELPVLNDRGNRAVLEHSGNMKLKWSFQDESPYEMYRGYKGPTDTLIFSNFDTIKVMDRDGNLQNEWPFKHKDIPAKINAIINKGLAESGSEPTQAFHVTKDNKTLEKIDPKTGKALWTYRLPVSEEKMGFSFLDYTVFLDPYGTVYISTQGGTLHALDSADGSLKFKLVFDHRTISSTEVLPLSATELVVLNDNAIMFFGIKE
ncbi:copper amine oxidase N-terminal domain-containing protein [Paenibacillus glacialis]|uniref:Uncharacterized protein n=1 Tax=Paenibacillus glacialis TaxID=494026 RepID=A0A168KMJ1_9BACL|nr:copper amine oxidase N-terminal domain-containing protein [Paenibacillus glacialis]OAB42219.1 hypothetical protein PGLA_12995 [Paenibacillus glacialis]